MEDRSTRAGRRAARRQARLDEAAAAEEKAGADRALAAGLAASDTAAPSRLSFGARIRNYFLTGLVVVGPVTITLYVTWTIIRAFDGWVKPYIPSIYNPDNYLPFAVPGAGLLFAIVSLVLIGALAANLIGRSLINASERMLERMPIVRNLYRGTKQLFESVVSATGPEQAFQKVAVMEFPSPGIYALVFITGQVAGPISAVAPDDDLIAVFMPTHLMPPSGFTVFVPRSRVTVIDMSIEDAAKIILSAGMVTPQGQSRLRKLAGGEKPPAAEGEPAAPPQRESAGVT